MKLLLDQGLARGAADLLRAAGIDTIHVGEIGQSRAEDAAILEMGRKEERVVVTLDANFHPACPFWRDVSLSNSYSYRRIKGGWLGRTHKNCPFPM
jgi:hypothetical protein